MYLRSNKIVNDEGGSHQTDTNALCRYTLSPKSSVRSECNIVINNV